MLKLRHLLSSLIICSAVLVSSALAQSTLSQIEDTVTDPDGTPFSGTVVITWNGDGFPAGSNIAPHSTSAQIYTGALSVLLVPTTTASASSFYVAVYNSSDGLVTWSEDWDVPPSTTPLTLSQVRVSSSQGGSGGSGSGGSGGSGSGASGGSGSGGAGGASGSGGSGVTLPISIDDVSDLGDDLAAINTTLTTLTATTNTLSTTTTALTSTSASLQSSVSGLSSTVSGLNTTVSGLSGSLSTLTTTVTGLSNSQTSTASSLAGLTTTVNGIGATVSGLSSTVTGLSSSVTGLNTTVNGLSSTVSTQGNTISNLSTTTASLNTQVTGMASTVQGLTTTVSGLSTTVSSLTQSVASLTATVNSLSSGAGGPLFVDADTLAGTLNGTNPVFTLTKTPSPAASLELYRNGLMQTSGVDYTISSSTVTFTSASTPQPTDTLTAFYQIVGSGSAFVFSDDEVPGGTINGTNATFTLLNAPNPLLSLRLYKNGMLLFQNGDYTLSGSTITFTSGVIPQTGDQLAAYYRH